MFCTWGTGGLSCTCAEAGMARGMSSRLMANPAACIQLKQLTRVIKNLLPRTDLSPKATSGPFLRELQKTCLLFHPKGKGTRAHAASFPYLRMRQSPQNERTLAVRRRLG